MSFAKISIQEIQVLNEKKVSGLEMLIYSVIASHIHSNHKNTAYPSLNRIKDILGGNTRIQSIARAITSLVKKGLLEKGKVRSKQRFKLLHRPVTEKIKKICKGAKDFVRRIATENLLKPPSKVQKFKSNPIEEQKRNPPREEL